MLQRLPIALAQVKTSNNSYEDLSYEIRHIVYSLYQSNEIVLFVSEKLFPKGKK